MTSTISYILAPEPIWTLIDLNGLTAGGGFLFTYSSLDNAQLKTVYQDSGGVNKWTNPIQFDANGTAGPFYWEVDSANPDDLYFLAAFNAQMVPLWTINGFPISGGSGGGGGTTVYQTLTNFIANNQFIDHIDNTINPVNATNLVIAPSNHKGFTPALINPVVAPYGVVGPDIRFVKNNTAASDIITFPLFNLADSSLFPDITPVDYVNYTCTNSPIGETYKAFQFPITQKVKNLSGQQMTFNIWAKVATGTLSLVASTIQYFGSAPTASTPSELRTPIAAPMNLTTTWTLFSLNFIMPDISTYSIGALGFQTDDDAVYIHLEMPLGAPCNVSFTKPALYLGTVDPQIDFQNYDQINSVNSTPRTGDIKTSLLSSAPNGWVPMNDKSIGNVNSGATARANVDTFQLYKTIWDGVIDTWAPVSDGRGSTAIADFIANKTLTLPLSLGRAMSGAGTGDGLTARALGENLGLEAISIAQMPTHSHPATRGNFVEVLGSPIGSFAGTGTFGPLTSDATTGPMGNGDSDGNMPPSSYFNIFIKL